MSWITNIRKKYFFLSTFGHLSLFLRLCVVDSNRIFLQSRLCSLVIALCLAEQSQCSIKLWHIHLSHSLWSERKPEEDTDTHTLGYDSKKSVSVQSTSAFYCILMLKTKQNASAPIVSFWHGHVRELLGKLLKKTQLGTCKRKESRPNWDWSTQTVFTVSDHWI